MRSLKEIKEKEIRNKIIAEVKKAKKEILVTMEVTEEIKSPLPRGYFLLLKRKHKQGVTVQRIVFGPVNKYKILLKNIKGNKLFFVGKYTKSKNYKRMIMIDGEKLFFRRKLGTLFKFYFTTDKDYLKKYQSYFRKFT